MSDVGIRCTPSSPTSRIYLLLLFAAIGGGCGGDDAGKPRPPSPVSGSSGQAGAGIGGAGAGGNSSASGTGGAGAGTGGTGDAGSGVAGAAGATPVAGSAGAPPVVGPLPDYDSGDPALNQVRPGGICQRLATVQCAAEEHCCRSPGRTRDACISTQMTVCTNDLQLDTIAGDVITGFDGAKALAALTTFEQMAMSCDPMIAVWGSSTAAVRSMLQGSVDAGGNCAPPQGSFPSVASYGAALASCKGLATHACLFSGSGPILPPDSGTCAERATQATTCFVDTNCVDDLFCDNPGGTYSGGTCASRRSAGAACMVGNSCESRVCKANLCLELSQDSAYCLMGQQ